MLEAANRVKNLCVFEKEIDSSAKLARIAKDRK